MIDLQSARQFSGVLVAALALLSVSMARAQGPRQALLEGHQAYDFAQLDRAAELLAVGMDPSGGPQDSLWVAGLHKLADALLHSVPRTVVAAWLRWAARLVPELSVDSVNFPSRWSRSSAWLCSS